MRRDQPTPITSQINQFIDVVDDAGLLFIADPSMPKLYIGEEWLWEEMHLRLIREMYPGHMLAWETALPWTYKLRFSSVAPKRPFAKAIVGLQIEVNGYLSAGSYADLTNPASDAHAVLATETIAVPKGVYHVDVYGMCPEPMAMHTENQFVFHETPAVPAHFHIHLQPTLFDFARNPLDRIPLLGANSRIYRDGTMPSQDSGWPR